MKKGTILYKGEERILPKIGNSVLMRFEQQGGRLAKFEEQPLTTAVTLIACALGLPGDPLDHADDLPPFTELAAIVKDALESSGLTNTDEPGETAGVAVALSVESSTD